MHNWVVLGKSHLVFSRQSKCCQDEGSLFKDVEKTKGTWIIVRRMSKSSVIIQNTGKGFLDFVQGNDIVTLFRCIIPLLMFEKKMKS